MLRINFNETKQQRLWRILGEALDVINPKYQKNAMLLFKKNRDKRNSQEKSHDSPEIFSESQIVNDLEEQ